MLDQETLKKYVTYCPESGKFFSTGQKYSNKTTNCEVGTVHKTKGYRYITIKGKTYRAQRLAFLWMTGQWPATQVDHINRIKDDNSWNNLRDVTPTRNSWNRPVYKTNKSGYTGVVWNKKQEKWQVLCRSEGNQVFLGLYVDVHEAGQVANTYYKSVR